jgi:dihydroorotase
MNLTIALTQPQENCIIDISAPTFFFSATETLQCTPKNFEHIQNALAQKKLLKIPGLIDPHVHFRTPGQEHKENWESASLAAIRGGYTTVFDMPNTIPTTITLERLHAKKALIDAQLKKIKIPLHYGLYLGASREHFDQIALCKNDIIGIKVFMGSSTGELLMDDLESLDQLFAIASKLDLLVAVHAESEAMIKQRKELLKDQHDYCIHSKIRTPEVAATAVKQAIDLARQHKTRLYILHVSSIPELELIKAAKQEGLEVFAETCPHYLFLTTKDYAHLQGCAQMNPALRDPVHQQALWQGLQDGTIDTIGSDHAPHTLAEKHEVFGCCPSGVPGIETTFPLLFTAHKQGRLSLEKLLDLTHYNPKKLLRLPSTKDFVVIDTDTQRTVDNANLATKARWSPYAGMDLYGWPVLMHFSH